MMLLRVGPLLLCIVVGVYRAIWLSGQLSSVASSEVGYLLLADLPVIGALGILAFTEATLSRAWKIVPLTLTVALTMLYVADALVVLSLNARLQLSDITIFGREWWLWRSFVSVTSVALLALSIGCMMVRLQVTTRVARVVLAGAIVLTLQTAATSRLAIPSHLQKYTGSVLLLARELWGARPQPLSRYQESDVAAYRDEYDTLFDAPFARSGKSIILVIVESLSAADSYRTSGLRTLLPRFDELSRKGMLFRKFFANFEASEGGIVSLLSGLPPLHFPTATTNTFGEYALQRSITDSFKRNGYHSEFLTSVPMQFISMDEYARSPSVGFSAAAGQQEIERFRGAPRFAFQSPADHLLYEELLARLDSSQRERPQPVLMVAVTASSHPPYVDPRGHESSEQNAWAYVQDELWWLYEQLDARGFFNNGVLVITGDHRKMLPLRQVERDRFGESAKARVPLAIIGAGVPQDVLDDRLFQQSDLLRLLDRAVQPGADLSPFVTWVERYEFVYGVASNASNLQVFDTSNGERFGYRMKLHGSEIEWLDRPANALAVERAVHRQRALQQAMRTSKTSQVAVNFGRDLVPSDRKPGVLVGLSTDLAVGRDPDDAGNELTLLTTGSFDLAKVLPLAGRKAPFTLTARAFLTIPRDGEYWFSIFASDENCLAIDQDLVLGCQRGLNEGVGLLTAGVHRFDLRFANRYADPFFQMRWLPPGEKQFTTFPQELLILPRSHD